MVTKIPFNAGKVCYILNMCLKFNAHYNSWWVGLIFATK